MDDFVPMTSSGKWISGLDEEQARQHPTRGGLRIGKRLDEPRPGEAVDETLHWEQDGQYFHYLTKWMHALNCVSRDTGEDIYNQWALELAKAAHAAFTYTPPSGGARRMYWKMSVDLSRPLVASMGHADPLDGLITYQQLRTTFKLSASSPESLDLRTEVEEMTRMCAGRSWVTEDALGIGGLLADACKLAQLVDIYQLDETGRLEALLRDIETSLKVFFMRRSLNLAAEHRLAFRELGLAIGLYAIAEIQSCIERHPENFANADQLIPLLKNLSQYQHIHELIEDFWLEPGHQSIRGWREHADINSVMLATSLEPQGYLEL